MTGAGMTETRSYLYGSNDLRWVYICFGALACYYFGVLGWALWRS